VIIGGYDKGYKPYEVFGSSNSFQSLRIFGEIDLDDWPVTQAKDKFDWDMNGLEQEFIEQLLELTKEYISKAKNYRINERNGTGKLSPIDIKDFAEDTLKDLKKINQNIVELDGSETDLVSIDEGSNIQVSSYYFNIEIKGCTYRVKVELVNDSEKQLFYVEESSNNVTLRINTCYPFFDRMENNKQFVGLLQKYLVIQYVAEKHSIRVSQYTDLVKPYSIRNTINMILDSIVREGVEVSYE
jgi:hypothetical protein